MATSSIKQAAYVNAAARYSTLLLRMLFNAVLARILVPDDYGIVAITAVFTTFFSLLADMGLGAGIIQNKELSRKDIGGIFAFSLRLGLVLMAAFAALSFPMARFYGREELVPVGLLLSVQLLLNTLNVVPNALLLKQKEFGKVALRILLSCLISGIAGILMALAGFKYYALVVQALLDAAFIFGWNYFSTRPPMTRKVDKASLEKIGRYSAYLFGFNLINYFARNTDNLLIGKVMGAAPLGFYDKSYRLMLYPVHNLTHVITPVLHPILSDHQRDKQYIYDKYLQVVKLLSLLGAFITPFFCFASTEVIRCMYGSQWDAAIPCLQWMSLAIWAQMILSSSGTIFQSLGDTRRLMLSGGLNAVLVVAFIIAGLVEGSLVAVSRNVAIAYNLQFVATFHILIHLSMGFRTRDFLRRFLPDLLVMAAVALAGYATTFFPPMNKWWSLLAKAAAMGGAYLLALTLTGQLKPLLSLLFKKTTNQNNKTHEQVS